MDAELRTYFERLEKRFDSMDQRLDSMDQRFDSMDQRMISMEERILSVVAGEIGSLHNEIEQLRTDTRSGFARIDERLDRQGFMLAGGTKALGALLEHVNGVETSYARMLAEVSDLSARVDRLEKKAS